MLEDQTDCAFILIKLMDLHMSVVSSLSFVAMVETAHDTCAFDVLCYLVPFINYLFFDCVRNCSQSKVFLLTVFSVSKMHKDLIPTQSTRLSYGDGW